MCFNLGNIVTAREQLQQCYIDSRFSSSVDEWPPYQPKHYTTLAFIHNKDKPSNAVRFFVLQQLAVAGKIPKHEYTLSDYNTSSLHTRPSAYTTMTKNISDIFLPVVTSDGSSVDLQFLLIEGAPGIGKTVLAKEIAYQWGKNNLLAAKRILLLVFLRDCNLKQMTTIEHLVEYTLKSSGITTCVANYLLQTGGKDVAIIFDGYDELSEENKKKSIIIDIINRRILNKSCLVITSRPTASSGLHRAVDRRVEIVGFTEEDRLDYIQSAFKNCDKQVEALQHYLQSNPTINAVCYIPLNMTILLCLAEHGIDTLPKTQTEMYRRFIEMTIVRFVKKYENCNSVINITNLPHPHDKMFVELAKLAYKALKTDKIVFTLPEIKKDCPNLTMTSSNWNGLGLLKAAQYFSADIGNDEVTLHFLHFSIQEYMAAWYISTLSNSKQIKLLRKTFWEHRYYNTWIMYVGITCGSSFALRHFLSDNKFQIYSKLCNNLPVSNKYLKHKMKCLHLFHCLVEANKEGIIDSVKQLFQNRQIDLSNQTLLPSDVNTLGFFLIRSINKEWDVLNLSNCNIGINGLNILCNTFSDKYVHCKVTIKMVYFSYNLLHFSSLSRLFGLFKSWHTSEVIITDDALAALDNTTDIIAIEDIILQSSTLILVFIGSYLFSKNVQSSQMFHVLSNTRSINSIYLLNCRWNLINSKISELLALLERQKLHKVRIIGPSINYFFIKTLISILLNNDSVNMLVYDPTMSDQIADDISSLISSSHDDVSGIMLIVSTSKVQGIVNTCALSNELSALEMFNLNIHIKYLNTKVCLWRQNLDGKSYNKEITIHTFVEMLYKTDWQLKIALIENDMLISHKVEFQSMNKLIHFTSNIKVAYLSNCGYTELEYDIFINCISHTHSTLYILNSPDGVEMLHARLLHKKFVPNKIFIYGNIKCSLLKSLIKLRSPYCHISAVSVANDVVVALYPSCEQIALAFRQQPSSLTWVQYTAVSTNVVYLIIDALAMLHTEWIKLDFTRCNIGDTECEIMHKILKVKSHPSTVRELKISLNKLSVLGISHLARIILIWRIQVLIIKGTNMLYNYLIKTLTSRSDCQHKIDLTIIYGREISYIISNTNWNKISTIMNRKVTELYIINCDLHLSKETISHLNEVHNLLRLCVINGTISETMVTEILKAFLNKAVEVSISNVRITDDNKMIKNVITSNPDIKLSLVLITAHWLCVHNNTKHQLHLIHQYFRNQLQPAFYAMTLVRKLECINGNKSYVFEYDLIKLVHFHAKVACASGATQIIAALRNTISLTTIEIDNYSITPENADALAKILQYNTQLQELQLNENGLQTSDVIKIAKALNCIPMFCNNTITDDKVTSDHSEMQEYKGKVITTKSVRLHNVTTLTKFSISNNSITDEAADDIAVTISNNIYLCELNLGGNSFQASGILKIARSLQKISSLTKLYINHNNITDEAADDIATAISCNFKLQEFDITQSNLQTTQSNLQTTGIVKILKALQGINTLKKLYLGNNNITGKVASDITTTILYNSQIEELDVCDSNLQPEGAIKIAKSLQHICTLKKLYISNNNITDKAADDIGAAISCNVHLQELSIDGNNIQASGATVIAKSLQNLSKLTKLYIDNNDITDEAADDIGAAISCNVHLQEFSIGGNNIQASGATVIAKSLQNLSKLTKLYIDNNDITDEAADDIGAAISCNVHLQEFSIGGNNIQASGATVIAKSLQNLSKLTKLYIDNNDITDEAADDIGAAISCNVHLQEFSIGGNNIQASGATVIAKSLQNLSKLTKLYIDNNNITDEAADDIATAIARNTCLQEFYICGNDLQTTGIKKIAKALQGVYTLTKLYLNNNNITDDQATNDIAAVISCNIKLEEFDISENNLATRGAINIAVALQSIVTLKKLCLRNNNITCQVEKYTIAGAVTCNTNLQEFNISGNNIQALGATVIAKGLQKLSKLTKLYIDNNDITDEAADDIGAAISCNVHLQEFSIGGNNLQASGATVIAKGLQKLSKLTKLYIDNNDITDEAADDIGAAISYNVHLQEFSIGGNNIQASGATVIAKSLQNLSKLTKLYIDNNNITDEAADDIAAAISCNVHLQEFSIGENNIQASGATVIAKGLQNLSKLTKLYIDNNDITDEAADDIGAAISCNVHLQLFSVDGNNLQASGATVIAKGLQKLSKLTKLYIDNNDITDEAADDIGAAISCNVHLQEFSIGGNNIQASGATVIAKSLQNLSKLTKLYIDNNNITDKAADDIAAAISCNVHLQEFSIGENNIQASGATVIAKSLQNLSKLTKLYIDNNNITDEAADDIATGISCNTCLQEFYICGNDLQTTGIKKIAKALQGVCTLTKLYLNNNSITDDQATNDIAAVISCNAKLEEFDISGNNLATRGAIKIAIALQSIVTLKKLCLRNNNLTRQVAKYIVGAITCNTNLQEFNISGNNLQASGATVIAKGLQKLSKLTKLYIDNNNITDEAADDIGAAISCNVHLQEFSIGENNIQASGATVIAKSLQKLSKLTILHIDSNNITDEAADDIATVISCNTCLQEFYICGNDLQTTGIKKIAKALQGVCTLTKLYLNNNSITDDQVTNDIAAVISCNTKLEEFDISGNNLATRGAINIAVALQSIVTLKKLCLRNNNITHQVAKYIVGAITCNTNLQEFNISGNNLQASGASVIAKGLQKLSKLTKLYIDSNDITDEAADDIATAIARNTCLQEFYICGNDLQITGIKKIAKALQGVCTLIKLYLNNNNITDDQATNDIAAVISCNTKLEEFDISGNNLATRGAINIAVALQSIVTLKKLCLRNNNITCQVANYIAGAITCNTNLQEFNISGNNLQASGATVIAKGLQKLSKLTKLYIDNNDITDEAADDIGAAISCNVHLQEFSIGGNNIQASGATVIAKSLQNLSKLTKLYIDNNDITDEAADDIGAAISCNVHLQEFSIGGNNIQASGATVIAKSLQNLSKLTKLYIDNNNITDEAADDIAAAVVCNSKLQEFDISQNNLQTTGAIKIVQVLKGMNTLKKLYLGNNNITGKVASDIATTVLYNAQMEELDVCDSNLQVEGVIKIAKSLQHICTLKMLYINNNNITDKAADDIGAAISCNVHLQEFSIGENNIQASGATIIAKSLQELSKLTKLYIANNNITDEAADDIAAAISCNVHLQEFSIGENNIQASGAIKIAKGLQSISTLTKLCIKHNNISDEAADEIAIAISCNTHLQELDIGINKLCGPGAITIAKALQDISTLTKLCIDHNNITDEAADDIGFAIRCNTNLQEVHIRKNKFHKDSVLKIASFATSYTISKNIRAGL